MSDLTELRAGRSDATVQQLAKRIEPTIGFVVYGIVVLFVSSFPAVVGGVLGAMGMHFIGFAKEAAATQIVAFALSIACWIAAWIPYVRWARRRRRAARTIVRDGVLCDAIVATSPTDQLAQLAVRVAINAAGSAGVAQTWDRVVFAHAGQTYAAVAPFDRAPEQGAITTVLFAPAAPYALAFSPSGRAFVVKPHPAAT